MFREGGYKPEEQENFSAEPQENQSKNPEPKKKHGLARKLGAVAAFGLATTSAEAFPAYVVIDGADKQVAANREKQEMANEIYLEHQLETLQSTMPQLKTILKDARIRKRPNSETAYDIYLLSKNAILTIDLGKQPEYEGDGLTKDGKFDDPKPKEASDKGFSSKVLDALTSADIIRLEPGPDGTVHVSVVETH